VARVDRTPQGIGPVDARYVEGALSASLSSYTQAGPRPGPAVATTAKQNASPILSGAQDEALDVKVSKSGDPSIERRGAAYLYKLDSETSPDDYRGWASPVFAQRAATVHFSTTAAITSLDACTDRDDQRVTVLFAEGATTPLSTRTLTEATQALTASAQVLTLGGGAGSMRGPASITSLPDGRRVILEWYGPANLQGPTSYTQSIYGGSWVELSDDPFPGGTSWVSGSVDGLWIRYARGQIIALITDTGGYLHQLASADLGSSWRYVEAVAGVSGQGVGVDVYPDGTILVVYHRTATNKLTAVRLGSAFAPISEAPAVDLPTRADVTQAEVPLTVTVDADGTAYAITYDSVNDGASSLYLITYESTDGGITWTEYTDGPIGSLEIGDWSMLRSVASNGRIHLFGATDNLTAGASMFTLSGWHNVTPGPNHTNPTRDGFMGAYGGTARLGGQWWSVTTPTSGNTGYTPSGSGSGVIAGTSDDAYLAVITSAASNRFYLAQQAGVTAGADAAVAWSCEVISGGALSTTDIGVTLRHRNLSGNLITLEVNLSATDQIRFSDGTTAITVSADVTARRDYILELSGGSTARLYSRPSPADLWELHGTITVTPGAASTTARTTWGHLNAAASSSRWWWVTHRHEDIELLRSHGQGIGDQVGKRIAGVPYPLPGIGSSTASAFLRVVGGHNRPLSSPDFNLDPAYDYPIGAVFPTASPSPSATWRTTADGTNTDLVIELQGGQDSRLDEALPVVVVRGANFDRLEVSTGDATPTYTLRGTLDLRFPSVAYTLTGDAGEVAGAPGTVTRWLHADELVGGYLDFGSGVRRRITSHTAGYLANTATVKPVFRINDPGGVPASGSMTPIHHSGVLVLSGYTPAPVRYWRLRIPTQTTAEGYYEAGTIALGALVVPGKRWADGFSYAVEPVISSSDSQSGTRRIEERGPPRRRLTVSWSHGSKIDRLRGNASQVDHLSAGPATPALAGRDDVLWQLEALQKRAQSGRIPVVVVPQIPSQTATITDPSLYLFGLIEGSVQAAQVVGDEGVDEYVRVESLTVTELT
jgi:hypothetical protein